MLDARCAFYLQTLPSRPARPCPAGGCPALHTYLQTYKPTCQPTLLIEGHSMAVPRHVVPFDKPFDAYKHIENNAWVNRMQAAGWIGMAIFLNK